MKHSWSLQTKSFLVIFFALVTGSALSILTASRSSLFFSENFQQIAFFPYAKKVKIKPQPAEQPIDTSAWQEIILEKYGLKLKANPAWKVKPEKKNLENIIIEIDPGKNYYNFKLYISETGFYAMENLPAEDTSIGGLPGKKISDLLYGVKSGKYYFTFDIGQSLALWPEFRAMVNSVNFLN